MHDGPSGRSVRAVALVATTAGVMGAIMAPAHAKPPPHCMARIIADVPAQEAPEEIMSKSNGDFGPIIQLKVDKRSGKMFYCAKDSYCYGSNAFEITSPCRIKRDPDNASDTYFSYFTR